MLEEECFNQGYSKVNGTYYKIKKEAPYIKLTRINCNKYFLKNYKKISENTFRKIPMPIDVASNRVQINNFQGSIPISALRQLINKSSPPKKKRKVCFSSLVKTNEILVYVCEYCSRVFKFKHNLNKHSLCVHQKNIREYVALTRSPLLQSENMSKKPSTTTYSPNTVLVTGQHFNEGINYNSPIKNSLQAISYTENTHDSITNNTVNDIRNRKAIMNRTSRKNAKSSRLMQKLKKKLNNIMNMREENEQRDFVELSSCLDNMKVNVKNINMGRANQKLLLNTKDLPVSSSESSSCVKEYGKGLNSNVKKWSNVMKFSRIRKTLGSCNKEDSYELQRSPVSNNDYHIQNFNTAIFGKRSKVNPRLMHNDIFNSAIIKDHTYARKYIHYKEMIRERKTAESTSHF